MVEERKDDNDDIRSGGGVDQRVIEMDRIEGMV